jgi:hypothetical protein
MNIDFVPKFINVQKEGLELFKKKNKDYGNAFALYGPIGVIIRMNDKVNRLMSVTNQGINLVPTETLRDTLIDLHNYSAMVITLMDMKEKVEHPRVTQIKNDNRIIN